MFWTLLLVLVVTWLLALVGGAGEPWSWLLPAAVGAAVVVRVVRSERRRREG